MLRHEGSTPSVRTMRNNNNKATKRFHIGDVLSVTTGVLVGPGHVGGIYEVVDHMVGRPHWTHELPTASEQVVPEILRQVPEIAEAKPPQINGEEEAEAWVASVAMYIGREYVDLTSESGREDEQ